MIYFYYSNFNRITRERKDYCKDLVKTTLVDLMSDQNKIFVVNWIKIKLLEISGKWAMFKFELLL